MKEISKMQNEKILTIVKGEEFKINIEKEINENDIFYDQYVRSAKILDDIIVFDDKQETEEWLKTDSENNIIAFCGERGEGKSSAMMSFIHAAYTLNTTEKSNIFFDCENVKKTLFAEPMVMDPSMFDDVHNVLDIVLATLYKKFREKYDLNNQCLGVEEREKLLGQFQKVYRCVSLINNQAKMLDDEYDYEGNIGKLAKLGESTELRNELKKLIELYLDVMLNSLNSNKKSKSLLIAIDDLDLCSSNAYKMAEQIRKYLIIPQVVIVMAVKIEQLQLCVREENYRSYCKIIKEESQNFAISSEINDMAERYVAKLIPRSRRIYLPKVQAILHAKILYKNKDKEKIFESSIKENISEAVLDYIFLKTGMKFLMNKSKENFLLPDNLRDMVNMIILLGDMREPNQDNHIYYDNIQKFCSYYEMEWLPNHLVPENCREIQNLVHSNYIHLHEDSEFILRKFYDLAEKKFSPPTANYFSEMSYSFFRVINMLEIFRKNVFGKEEERDVYAFYILYTIRLNELLRREEYDGLTKFLGGYVWAGSFENILPNTQGNINRSRFSLYSINVFNIIAKKLYQDKDILLTDMAASQNYVSKISQEDENREEKIWTWLLLGLLSNTYMAPQFNQITYTFYTSPVIFSNYTLLYNVQICLENYMVGLCNLTSLYDKINLGLLGVERQEFDKFIDKIETYNKDIIDAFRKILMNVDMALEFKEYCQENRNSREGGSKDEVGRTKAAVDQFFRNVENFMKKCGEGDKSIKFHPLILQCDEDGNKKEVDISQLYSLLVQEFEYNMENNPMNMNQKKKEKAMQLFVSKLQDRMVYKTPAYTVSTYLRNKSVENAKTNMDHLASRIQRYYSKHQEEQPENSSIAALTNFYSKIMDLYITDDKTSISDTLYEEYREIVQKFRKECQYRE